MKKKFKKQDLIELVNGGDVSGLNEVDDSICGSGKWSTHHKLIFQEVGTGKFYMVKYFRAATEQQDERPFEYEGNEVECTEVTPVEVVQIEYQEVL